ncbi:MAG: hypothetical protein WB988_14155 [Candidatus Nitrosopolaris sp.]
MKLLLQQLKNLEYQFNALQFKNLVLSAVDRYFDQGIYDDVMTEFTPQDIEKLLHEQVQFNDGVGGF